MIHTLEKMAEHKIMSKRFLRNLKMEKKVMIKLLSSAGWRRRLTELAREKDFTAAGMVQAVEPVLDKLADSPEGGWLHFSGMDSSGTAEDVPMMCVIILARKAAVFTEDRSRRKYIRRSSTATGWS